MIPVEPPVPPRLALRQLVLPGVGPVDLIVAAGQLLSVSGGTGSDVLWAVAGLRRPTAGEILVDGRRIADHAQALAAGVALIPQGNALATLLTAFENVYLPLAAPRLVSSPGSDVDHPAAADPAETARQALTAVGLADSADHLVEELSGGQQQRVAVARAIALRPRLLLADQATTDLDPANRRLVLGLLREQAALGTAVLVSTDDPAVSDACDQSIELESAAAP